MRFSNKKGRKKVSNSSLFIPAGCFLCKKDKTGFDFRKESEISLTGLSFWFQWESQPKEPKMQSRQRASPFWLDRLTNRKGQSPPEHASQPLFRPEKIVESISQRFFSPLITPSQPARPIDLVRSANSKGLIWSEVVGTNLVCFIEKGFLRGSWLAPYFQPLQLASTSFAIRTRRRRRAAEIKKRRAKIPDPKQACY